ncbi:Protein kinase domain [Macleaya cordata]|uniref:Protein kinase domain n=1 Tax=Macleaya cordata TaxID=56857 RepID=A0A200R5B0_MACCD|nr:Protein kinase domain [Macleaya cordata]
MGWFPLVSTIVISLLLSSSSSSSTAQLTNDTEALTQFRLQTDTHGNLLTNWTTGDACSAAWRGVQCTNGRVTSLSLPSLDLRGPIDSISQLDQLRFLDLHSNRFNSTILPITNCSNLKLIYLSGNDFSGEIPTSINALKRLLRLDISDNNLHGPIPNEITKLTRLMTLRLQNNLLSGLVPDLSISLPNLTELNLSNNDLSGKVPEGLYTKFGEKSFVGNAGLCGSGSFHVCSFPNNSPPSAATAAQSVVPSNPSSLPATPAADQGKKGSNKGLSIGAIVAIVVGNAVFLLVITSFIVAYYCGRYSRENSNGEKGRRGNYNGEKRVYASNGGGGESDGTTASDRSKLVFFDRRKQFQLEDLLRASAEMLGKGNLGTVYRAVLEDGSTVAVKRLKDANPCERKEFEQYMDVIGKLRHPNIVRLRAYYYAKEEKLLVYDYLSNGSLHSLLHGSRGPGRIPLDWTTRISLVLGAARGLARIHEEYSESKVPHGNVKSSNVLLDKNGVACISDFGLALLLNPIHATARLGGYRAPEQAENKKLSQMADVYSFGVLLLEVLTGKAPTLYPSPSNPRQEDDGVDLPTWVRSVVRDEWTAEVFDPELLRYKNIEEELVAMLHVGLACVAQQAEKRPRMSDVVKMIEEFRVEQSPMREDLDESRSSLSPSLATTEDAVTNY